MNYSYRFKLSNLLLGIIIVVCIFGLWLHPINASNQAKAPVVLDGQPIFQINETDQFTAQDHADLVDFQLKAAMQSDLPVKVTLENRNQLPAIFLNDRYLLTVTERDAIAGLTADEQAKIWVQEIQVVAQKTQIERSQEYLQNMLILSMGILLVAIALSWRLVWLRRYLSDIAKQKWISTDSETIPKGMELFFKLILAITRTCVWLVAILYIANLFPVSRSLSYQVQNILLSSFTSPLLTLGKSSYSVIDLLILVALLFGVVFLARTSTNILRERFLNLAGLCRGVQEAIAVLAQYGLIFIGALVLLQAWGLDPTIYIQSPITI
ncbi:hypothetical protein H6F44_20875 [Pseudanabaena sp. FACHB-1277]|uniref:Mechanosensitive ion channel protein MscS n=1 Tax=Pseudanabaena cinerea FACHB-1277 TaxID=2949581 RepID=A0A926Z8B8_9CYAN|nr:hypothetical protein [Pseudanabaena cinerea]MBD2152553.1 hypothetical protein [Pseudanabaena cinerea FACHB-1277]